MNNATSAHTADEYRAMAQACSDERARSWEDSDTDGFMSQWANQVIAGRYLDAARILDQGGVNTFHAVFDLNGNYMEAEESKGEYGMYYFIRSAEGKARYFTPSLAQNKKTEVKNNAKKGYYFGKASFAMTFDRWGKGTIGEMIEVIDNGQEALAELGLI